MCIKENIIRVKTGICWYNESNTVCAIVFRGGMQWHPDIFASKWDERFFSFGFDLPSSLQVFIPSGIWGSVFPLCTHLPFTYCHTFSQCCQISTYNKDLLHQIWLPCCQDSYWSLGRKRSNERWLEHLFKCCLPHPPLFLCLVLTVLQPASALRIIGW